MLPEKIRELLHREPFEPLSFHTKGGKSYEVRRRGMVLVFADYLVIGIKENRDPSPIADDHVRIMLEDLDRIDCVRAVTVLKTSEMPSSTGGMADAS